MFNSQAENMFKTASGVINNILLQTTQLREVAWHIQTKLPRREQQEHYLMLLIPTDS